MEEGSKTCPVGSYGYGIYTSNSNSRLDNFAIWCNGTDTLAINKTIAVKNIYPNGWFGTNVTLESFPGSINTTVNSKGCITSINVTNTYNTTKKFLLGYNYTYTSQCVKIDFQWKDTVKPKITITRTPEFVIPKKSTSYKLQVSQLLIICMIIMFI